MVLFFIFNVLFWGGVLLTITAYLETRRHKITRYEAKLRKPLPRTIRILHLSDTHFSKPNPLSLRFFERLMQESYDFIFVTGDIFDCEKGIPPGLEHLRKLKAGGGVFAVFGNHDYYDYWFADFLLHNFPHQKKPRHKQSAALFERALAEAGIVLLKNETVEKEIEGAPILIHGIDDATAGYANVRKAMQNFEPSKVNILLTHTIDVFMDIGEDEIDLSFSGHSHGGQIRLPWIGPLITHTVYGVEYTCGLKSLQGAVCSISRGLGTSRFVPFRLLCPPEAIVLTVRGSGRIYP